MLDALRIRTRAIRTMLLVVIACALFARILIPQGWMPVKTAAGWRVTLCSGAGPMRMDMSAMAMPMGGKHSHPSQHDQGSDHSCPYASLAMALDEPPPVALVVPVRSLDRAAEGNGVATAIGRGLAAPPPPATGPPLV